MTNDEIRYYLDKIASSAGEHFDSVQVLVSWNEDGKTRDYFTGTGNFYARLGMAREFIQRDVAQESARQIGEALKVEEE